MTGRYPDIAGVPGVVRQNAPNSQLPRSYGPYASDMLKMKRRHGHDRQVASRIRIPEYSKRSRLRLLLDSSAI